MNTPVVAAREDAALRAHRIRAGITNYLETLAEVAIAYQQRDWTALGYESWDAYVAGEFGEQRLRLDRESRQQAVEALRLAGLSTRAIASAVGVAQETVRRDLATDSNGSVAEVTGINGKTYAPTAPPRAPSPTFEDVEPDAELLDEDWPPTAEPADEPEPEPVRKSNRRPLTEAFRDATYDLTKIAERIERLTADDRFPRNAEQVSASCRADLLRAAELLTTAIDRISTTN